MTTPPQPVHCSTCGAAAPSPGPPPVDWMRDTDPDRGTVWVCPDCVRANVRSIEARLNQRWW